jgi:hypothetical protein
LQIVYLGLYICELLFKRTLKEMENKR